MNTFSVFCFFLFRLSFQTEKQKSLLASELTPFPFWHNTTLLWSWEVLFPDNPALLPAAYCMPQHSLSVFCNILVTLYSLFSVCAYSLSSLLAPLLLVRTLQHVICSTDADDFILYVSPLCHKVPSASTCAALRPAQHENRLPLHYHTAQASRALLPIALKIMNIWDLNCFFSSQNTNYL